ncbi:MAG: DUF4296 domain-containing protein [Chitinophagales bacterium]
MSLILIILCFACNINEVKTPKNILDETSMINVLVDIHIADGMAINSKISNAKLLNQVKKLYLESSLEKNNITLEQFEESLTFYETNPELLFQIYEKVMIEISTLEAEVNGTKEEK